MVKPKARGTQFEYRTAYLFAKYGFKWDRSRSSLGTDLKISKNGQLRYLVSCKKTATKEIIYLPREEAEKLARESTEREAQGLICFGFNRTPVYAIRIENLRNVESTKKSYKLSPNSGILLKDILTE